MKPMKFMSLTNEVNARKCLLDQVYSLPNGKYYEVIKDIRQ